MGKIKFFVYVCFILFVTIFISAVVCIFFLSCKTKGNMRTQLIVPVTSSQYKIGETISYDNIDYTVTSINVAKPTAYTEVKNPKDKFLFIGINIENKSDDFFGYSAGDFYLKDLNGIIIYPESKMLNKSDSVMLGTISPKQKIQSGILFEIPNKTAQFILYFDYRKRNHPEYQYIINVPTNFDF